MWILPLLQEKVSKHVLILITIASCSSSTCVIIKQCNSPVYADTRCRRHIALPAKRHIRRMQQTPGIHWETRILREREAKRRREETETHREQRISAFNVILPDVQSLSSVLNKVTRLPVLGRYKGIIRSCAFLPSFLPFPIHLCHLASVISKTQSQM